MSPHKRLAAAALLVACTATHAASVNLEAAYVGPNTYVATLQTAAGKDFTPGNGTDSIRAGLIQASGPGGSFFAYAIEPSAPLTTALTSYDSTTYTPSLAVQQLYSGYYSRVVDPSTGAAVGGDSIDEVAFQIALWELAVDDGNLATGDLSFAGVFDASTLVFVTRAQFFLSNLPGTVTTEYSFTRYSAPNTVGAGGALTGSQDLLRATVATAADVTGVPEPGTYGLVLAALVALKTLGRRGQAHRAALP